MANISNELTLVRTDCQATTCVLTMYDEKRLAGSCFLAWLTTVVNKYSFESTESGLFSSNDANKTEECYLDNLCYPLC